MYLTRIEIENVRGFREGGAKTSIELPARGAGWHVFAGRNGSGKSTLLRAVALAVVGPEHARHLVPSFAGWIRKGASRASVHVKITRASDDAYQGMGKLPKDAVSAALAWETGAGGIEPRLVSTPQRQTKLKGPWRGPWAENPAGWLVAGYGPFRRLTGHGPDALRVMVGPDHQRRLVSLFREDASLLEAAGWLQELQFRKLEGREEAATILEDVLALLNDGLLPDDSTVERVDSDGLWVKRGTSVLELRDLSDGYRVALALVIDIIRHMAGAFGKLRVVRKKGAPIHVDMAAVVLIDEADAHLHVSWQQRIGFWLAERFPKVQFLVTTHSPFTCQAATEGGLFTLAGPGEERGAELVDDATFKKVVNGTPNDAVLSKLFGLDRVRSERAERMTKEWSSLRANLAHRPLSAKERQRMRELENQLPLPFESTAAE